ncbi:MAG: hypothetical protein LBU99_04010 [Spirochaetaceae bacterium]|jgi:hypothetical protein|nr:hypothetical protein [Spirochaetaceae bacterium]
MDYTKYSYNILCEDRRHYDFVRTYLVKKNVSGRNIRNTEGLPEGSGDAKKFIDNHYDHALSKIRAHENHILIVVRDADKLQNSSAYIESLIGKYTCSCGKKVFSVITNRNIETWFYFIDNPSSQDSRDESTDRKYSYPKNGTKDTEYGKKIGEVVNSVKNGEKNDCMPHSLQRMIELLIKVENNC